MRRPGSEFDLWPDSWARSLLSEKETGIAELTKESQNLGLERGRRPALK